jgi:uncharacterized protein
VGSTPTGHKTTTDRVYIEVILRNYMIRKSFIFLEKIRNTKEQNIWKQAADWKQFLKRDNIKGISAQKKHYYNRLIKEAEVALFSRNYNYFIGKLPQKEMWRMYDFCRDECCFLDIEVNSQGKIILVSISNYYDTNFFVKHVNLYRRNLEKELAKYKLVITFNGGAFDLPKLRKQLEVDVKMPHIDLKPLCVNLGLKGGLKEVEKILGLNRPSNLKGNPVDLWKAFHASGDKEYLDLLIEYNREDSENLKGVMEYVYGQLSKNI